MFYLWPIEKLLTLCPLYMYISCVCLSYSINLHTTRILALWPFANPFIASKKDTLLSITLMNRNMRESK